MIPLRLSEIKEILHADQIGEGNPRIDAVCTDTRKMQPDSVFVALCGESFDGAEFVAQASAGGAVAAIVGGRPGAAVDIPLLLVKDARAAMGKLAAEIRRRLQSKVIAVAGSNGKTGTKLLIDAALREQLHGTYSPKSFNNDIGVPLAIFPAEPVQDYLILEVGTNHPGEIRNLTQIAQPDIAVITNCSAEHLEGLGDLSGVRKENASIIEGLKPDGLLVVNGDDAELLKCVQGFRGERVTFGLGQNNDLFASNISCREDGTRFYLNGGNAGVFLPVLGKHSAVNALTAIAVGRALGLSDAEILAGLQHASGPEMRLQLQDAAGVRILNDAYNANPASMRAALETLSSLPTRGRRIAVLGDMRELGATSEQCHREIGRIVAREFRPDRLICVGRASLAIAADAQLNGFSADFVQHFPDAQAAAVVAQHVRDGDLVLLKGSRAIGLEAVGRAIFARRAVKVA